ncbi:hypothetical protein [Pedobacter gandavensis]|uniref:Uncharacterized protein n=1 Tax=Pedobacter gandavensis TaxID=2679963 RepID=A0ABR6EU35_9SPHI|nr:hypothetical protein [Pedobacter gandavensis]MBB2148778.1 hypothetical protein [Pedobacter gandavensis]
MRKLFIMPFFVLFMTGATSNGVKPQSIPEEKASTLNTPISVKVDSVNARAQELDRLIKQL